MELFKEPIKQQKDIDKVDGRLITKILELYNIDAIVAGGYPRDLAFGEIPKDMDIFVVDFNSVLDLCDSLNIRYTLFENYESTGETNRFGRVLKIGDVDIIECATHIEHPINQVLDLFDYNINQWCLINDKPVFVGQNFGTLERASKECVTEKRIQYITKKAIKRGWNVKTTNDRLIAEREKFALEQQAKGIDWVLACRELNLSKGDVHTFIDKRNQLRQQAEKDTEL
jgi:hypothetical protein